MNIYLLQGLLKVFTQWIEWICEMCNGDWTQKILKSTMFPFSSFKVLLTLESPIQPFITSYEQPYVKLNLFGNKVSSFFFSNRERHYSESATFDWLYFPFGCTKKGKEEKNPNFSQLIRSTNLYHFCDVIGHVPF